MAYIKQNFSDGDVLHASSLNAMDEQIFENESQITLKYQKPTGGIPKADLADDTREVFIAEYGVTTYSEVASAFAAGKYICAEFETGEGYKRRYDLTQHKNTEANFGLSINSNIYWLTLSSGNVWSAGSLTKINEISGSGSSSQYPSTQAVVNYAMPKTAIVTCTQAEYDAIATKSADTIYMIVEEPA